CDLFFFQAEDGIRDRNVTGVQTCALPIWPTGFGVAGVRCRRPRKNPHVEVVRYASGIRARWAGAWFRPNRGVVGTTEIHRVARWAYFRQGNGPAGEESRLRRGSARVGRSRGRAGS